MASRSCVSSDSSLRHLASSVPGARQHARHVRVSGTALLLTSALLSAGSLAHGQCTDVTVCGEWGEAWSLVVSDLTPGAIDEIAHASLIPRGSHQDKILVWTRQNTSLMSHIWDPDTSVVIPIPFGAATGGENPFCSGHVWTSDGNLLAVGGQNGAYGSDKVYMLDLDAPSPVWISKPSLVFASVSKPRYYPGVIVYPDPVLGSRILVAGGTSRVGNIVQLAYHWQEWLLNDSPNASVPWIEQADNGSIPIACGTGFACHDDYPQWWPYHWHQYPRTLLLSNGRVISVAHTAIYDDDGPPPGTPPFDDYGGNPVHVIDVLNQTLSCGPCEDDPNDADGAPMKNAQVVQTRARHYANAILMHTLIAGWTWPLDPSPPSVVQRYQKDRILVYGGTPEVPDDLANFDPPAIDIIQDLRDADTIPWWFQKDKADSSDNIRINGNMVALPDGNIFVVGGQPSFESIFQFYYDTSEVFAPGFPGSDGLWIPMASRKPDPNSHFEPKKAVPRGYHSAALLRSNGSVVLIGGVEAPDMDAAEIRPDDSAEIYKPPYFFARRPWLEGVPQQIQYGQPFCVQAPAGIQRACLIGVPSVTHFFDFNQRYVELMVRAGSGCPNVQVMPPPLAEMAPPGYYLLFIVDNAGVPSNGAFVRLAY